MNDNEQKLIDEAVANSEKWVEALKFDGKPDIEAIREVLAARTFEGKPVEALVARCPEEAVELLNKWLDEQPEDEREEYAKVIRNARRCVWDYYLMAFYESACSVLPNKDFEGAEFIYQSLFPAFEKGLGFLIALGELVVGVCLPEAYRDDNMRIHRENGPAIIWGNTKQYWWHGTEVPAEWIEDKENVDPALCLTHENIEQRRCLCEILGWDKVVEMLKPRVIDEDVEFGKSRTLLEVDLPDSGTERFVRVVCATGRVFCLPVPRTVTTAQEAVSVTYGVDPSDYQPEVRT